MEVVAPRIESEGGAEGTYPGHFDGGRYFAILASSHGATQTKKGRPKNARLRQVAKVHARKVKQSVRHERCELLRKLICR